ncbi:hypothetical protein KFE25_001764 [Diacronema lutheri]|uniref:RNA polymerase III subunit Rpc25 domain-containing protein n=1 Tax=Diacronema lutheri TaxID=2081491 RepID=A0A8J5XCH7_DIALT|nr:hypothetical protein KFE25_001764 [Diacronema lutheri]
MFSLVMLEDTVKVQPSDFHLPTHEALVSAVNCKFANKVIIDVGLCLRLYDIASIGEAFLHPGDAAQHVALVFRIIVFCPFVGQILVGKITTLSKDGLVVSLEFFDNVVITPENMRQPVAFEEAELDAKGATLVNAAWCWKFNKQDFYIDVDEFIRFRVVEVAFNASNTFVDSGAQPRGGGGAGGGLAAGGAAGGQTGAGARAAAASGAAGGVAGGNMAAPGGACARAAGAPTGAAATAGAASALAGKPGSARGGSSAIITAPPSLAPMIVKGAIAEDGLGLVSWWAEATDMSQRGDGNSDAES